LGVGAGVGAGLLHAAAASARPAASAIGRERVICRPGMKRRLAEARSGGVLGRFELETL
jgi:hypothetical protein